MEHIDDSESLAKNRGPNRPTPDLIKQVCNLIEEGLPISSVLDYLGISPQTFYTWYRKGKLYNEDPDLEPKHKIYGDFEIAIKRAHASYQLTLIRRLHKDEKWSRALAILERRDKKNFSKFDPFAGETLEQIDPDQKFS